MIFKGKNRGKNNVVGLAAVSLIQSSFALEDAFQKASLMKTKIPMIRASKPFQ